MSETQTIPDAAVAAALHELGIGPHGSSRAMVQVILEAAAPHMMTEAFEKGFQKGVEFQDWAGHLDNHKPDFTNPYRPKP